MTARVLTLDEESILLEALHPRLGKQNGTQHWVRTDAFPGEIVWEGREGRKAWEKSREKKDREGD
jgi:hypothetical protein